MKKIIYLFCLIFILISCKSKNVYDENGFLVTPDPISDNEKLLIMINQCIDDYNNDIIDEREVEWNTTIKPKPITVETIPNISNLSDLTKIDINKKLSSAVYSAYQEVGDYKLIYEIFNYGNNFWLYGNTNFEINLDSIKINNPDFKDTKDILDSLLKEDMDVLRWLYGINVELGEESKSEPGFYKVLSIGPYKYTSIKELKEKAESIFVRDFLESYYIPAFEGEDAIYKEIGGVLYCSESESNVFEGLPYDTTRIIAVEEKDDRVLIDLVIAFGEDISNSVERINLIKTEGGYRLDNAY